jgi:hypothetical protein
MPSDSGDCFIIAGESSYGDDDDDDDTEARYLCPRCTCLLDGLNVYLSGLNEDKSGDSRFGASTLSRGDANAGGLIVETSCCSPAKLRKLGM